MKQSLFYPIPLMLAVTTSAWAETKTSKETLDDVLKLDTIVVTANRDAQPRAETNATVSVFTREDIDRLQPSSVADLLNRVPGVQVTQTGGRGSVTSVFIRGTKTAQSLVLIDGQRVGSASAGGASLQYLSMDQIERVEVLRGSRSAIYGADAIGGVIQIFTRRANGNGINPRLRVAFGNRGTQESALGLSGGTDKTRFSLNAALNETNGIDSTRRSFPSDSDHDGYRNKSFSFTFSHQLTDDIELGFNALDQRGKSEYDNPYGRYDSSTYMTYATTKPYNLFALNSTSAYLNYHINDVWTSRLEVGHAEDKLKSKDKFSTESSIYNTYRDSATWLNTIDLNEKNRVLLGLDYLNDKLHASTDYNRTSRWNRAGFIQYDFKGDLIFTEVGLRHDKNQQFGSKNTWNGSVGFNINSTNQLIFSYAEGFRVPTFNDTYAPLGWGANPNLKPERSKSYEMQWRSQLTDKTYFEASLYHTLIRDAIVYSDIEMQNIDKARINGFEASLQQELSNQLFANVALSMVDPRDAKTGHTLPNQARRTLNVDLDKQLGNFTVGATWSLVSSSYGDTSNKISIPGYGLLGIRSSWQATPELKFDAKIDNLLDRSYYRATYNFKPDPNDWTMPTTPYGYREEGITVLVGLTWTPDFFNKKRP